MKLINKKNTTYYTDSPFTVFEIDNFLEYHIKGYWILVFLYWSLGGTEEWKILTLGFIY